MTMLERAELDGGEYIIEVPTRLKSGGSDYREVNLTTLLTPGARRTTDVGILLAEAERAAEGDCPGNPAIPASQDAARDVMQRLERRGMDPAWKVCPAADYPPSGGDGR